MNMLAKIIKGRGLSQRELAEQLGVTPAAVSQQVKHGMRLSPRLDNFYEKIGVKTLGLLYPTVCRLQVPK